MVLANEAANADGFSDEVQSKFDTSLNAKINTLKATAQDFWESAINGDGTKELVEGLTNVLQLVTDITDGIGGWGIALGTIGAIGGNAIFGNGFANGFQDIKGWFDSSKNINKYLGDTDFTNRLKTDVDSFKKGIDVNFEAYDVQANNVRNAMLKTAEAAGGVQNVSFEGVTASLKKMTLGAKAAALGMNLLATASGIAVGILVSVGISKVAEGFSNYTNAVENATEASANAASELSKAQSTYQNNTKFISDNIDRYEELNNKMRDHRELLSNSEMDEYESLTQSIAQQFPDLIVGYDSLGNAMIKAGDGATVLNEALAQQNEQLRQQAEVSLPIVQAGFKAQNEGAKFMQDASARDRIDALESLKQSITDEEKTAQELQGLFMSFGRSKGFTQELGESLGMSQQLIDAISADTDIGNRALMLNKNLQKEMEDLYKTDLNIGSLIDQEEASIQTEADGIISNLQAIMETEKEYISLSENAQNVLSSAFTGIDFSFVSDQGLDELGGVDKYIDNLFKKIEDKNLDVKMSGLFNLESDDVTNDTIAYYQNLSKEITDALGFDSEQAKVFNDNIGLNLDEFENAYKNASEEVKKVFSGSTARIDVRGQEFTDYINSLSQEELEILGEIEFTGVETLDDIKYKVEGIQKNSTISIDFVTNAANFESAYAAMTESLSGTGVTTDTLSQLVATYGDEIYSVLDRTANGVYLNQDAFEQLQQAQEGLVKQKLDDSVIALNSELAKTQELIKDYEQFSDSGGALPDYLQAYDIEALRNTEESLANQVREAELAASAYDGLTSAYNKWVQAQSVGSDADIYDQLFGSIGSAQEKFELGRTGDADFKARAELITGRDLTGQGNDAVREAYEQSVKVTDRYVTEDGSGMKNFLDDYFTVGEDGGYSFEGNTEEIVAQAREAGYTVGDEFVQTMLRASSAYGFDVDLDTDDMVLNLEMIKQKAIEARQVLGETYDPASMSVNELMIKQDELYKRRDSLPVDSTEYDHVNTLLTELEYKIQYLNESGGINLVDYSSIENMERIAEAGEKAKISLQELEEFKGFDFEMPTDVEGYEDQLEIMREMLANVGDGEGKIHLDDSELKSAVDYTRYLIQEKQKLENETLLKIDASQYNQEVQTAIEYIRQYKTAVDNLELAQASPNISTEELANYEAEVQRTVDLLSTLTVDIGVDYTKPETIIPAIEAGKTIISPEVDEAYAQKQLDELKEPFTVQGTVRMNAMAANLIRAKLEDPIYTTNYIRTVTTTIPSNGSILPGLPGSSVRASGSAQASGTAYVGGKWGINSNETALTGELGQEIVVRDGQWFTVGDNGAEFVNLQRGDIVFNHKQSKELLDKGNMVGRGRALAEGNAYANSSSSGKWYSNTTTSSKPASNAFTESVSKSTDAMDSVTEALDNMVDWIVVAVDRLQHVIDITLQRMERIVNLSTKQSELSKAQSTNEKLLQTAIAGANRYRQEANTVASKVGLSSSLQGLVQTGAIDITQYNESTKNAIDEYQTAYEKVLDMEQTIEDLIDKQAELAQQALDNVEEYYDTINSKTEALIDLTDSRLDLNDAVGGSAVSKEIIGMLQSSKASQEAITALLEQQVATFESEFNKQISSGYLKEGSQEWYDAQTKLVELKQEFIEASVSIEDFQDRINDVEYTAIQNVIDSFSNSISKLDDIFSLKEARDEDVTVEEYKQQIANNNSQIIEQNKMREALVKEQSLYNVDSTKYQELAQEIASADSAIYSLLNSNEALKDSIHEVRWKEFEEGQQEVNDTIGDLDNLRGLMNSESFIDSETGTLTAQGAANIGLIGEAMGLAKQQIADYTEAMKALDSEYAQGLISQDEYNEKQDQFLDGISNGVGVVENYKQELLDLHEEQMRAEVAATQKVIDKQKERLTVEKEYNDYAKKIADQNKSINQLKSQEAALLGVNNASAKAELKRIQEQLRSEEEALQETKDEREYEIRIEGLDSISDDMNENLEEVLYEVTYNAEKQQSVINSMLNNVVGMYDQAYGKIQDIIADTGLVLGDGASSSTGNLSSSSGAQDSVNEAIKNPSLFNPSGNISDLTDDIVNNSGGINNSGTIGDIENNIGKEPNTTNRLCAELKLSSTSVSVQAGSSSRLTISIRPTDAKNKNVVWSSSNPSVASVSGGTIKGISAGSATITATTVDGSNLTASCSVTVTPKPEPPKPPTTSGGGSSGSGGSGGGYGGIPFTHKKSYYPKDKLAIDTSVVDRFKYFDFDSSIGAREKVFNHFGGTGYRGSASQNIWLINKMKGAGYWTGTNNATAGLHRVDEYGSELKLKNIEHNGKKYTMFDAGDKVLKADWTNKLFNFAKNPSDFIANLMGGVPDSTSRRETNLNVEYNVNIENADANTASQLKNMIPEIVGEVTKEFKRELLKIR